MSFTSLAFMESSPWQTTGDPPRFTNGANAWLVGKRRTPTLSEFFREECVSPALFYYWTKRLKSHNEPNGTSRKRNAFHAVRLVETSLPERAMTVRLPGNIEIAVSANPAMAELVLEKILRGSAMLKEHTGC